MIKEGFKVNIDFSKYSGKYITIVDKKIVASGDDIKKIVGETKKKFPNKKIELMKVSKPETLVLIICK